jgi:hypothetical protein
MTTNYDGIAEEYQASKRQPWRAHVERHTPQVSPEGLRQSGEERWRGFLAPPPIVFLECVKEAL